MVDLSRVRDRNNNQARPILRRGSLFPRQDGPNESPQRRIASDMRAARRATPNADAIIQLAQQVNGTFQQVSEDRLERFAFNEQKNAFEAVSDANEGVMNEELAEKSKAYEIAHKGTLFRTALHTAQTKAVTAVNSLLNEFEGVNIEAALEAVEQITGETILSTITDDTGEIMDMGSARAAALASNQVSEMSRKIMEQAEQLFTTKAKMNLKDSQVNAGVQAIRAGETFDVADFVGTLKEADLTDEQIEKGIMEVLSVITSEDAVTAEQIASALLGIPADVAETRGVVSRDEDQAPAVKMAEGFQLSAAGIAQLSDVREQAGERRRVQAERAERERHDATNDMIYQNILNDKWPSNSQLRELVESGDMSARDANTFQNMRVSHERAQRAEARAAAAAANASYRSGVENMLAGLALEYRTGNGPANRGEFMRDFDRVMKQLPDNKSALSAFNLLNAAAQESWNGPMKSPDAKQYGQLLNNAFSGGGSTASAVSRLRMGNVETSAQRKTAAQGLYRDNIVNKNMSPVEAFIDVGKRFPEVSPDAALKARREELERRMGN